MTQPDPATTEPIEALCQAFRDDHHAVKTEIAKAIVGHAEVIDGVLICLLVGGHALLEGVPGLGKTALIRALASALHLEFSRIQFTPDLMPADVIGTNVIMENDAGRRQFQFMPGPIFGQIVLADEINRATPKTQSALLEAMQERQVTAGGQVRKLREPFFVMATQNPLEQEGTYPLPEAQLDRFFFKLTVGYSGREELHAILEKTTTGHVEPINAVLDGDRIIAHQKLVRQVVIAPHVRDYAIRCTLATHPGGIFAAPETERFVRVGVSPRAAQAMVLGAKVKALLDQRFHVGFADIRAVALAAMRHRIILNFEAEAEGMTPDAVLERILAATPTALEGEAIAKERR